jgi:hypothetical protein
LRRALAVRWRIPSNQPTGRRSTMRERTYITTDGVAMAQW